MTHVTCKPISILLAFLLCLGAAWANGTETTEGNEFEGLIEPFEIVNVGTPVEGVVEQVNVKRSALVKQGEPLVKLESSVENSVVKRAKVLAAVEGEIKLQKERLAFAKRMHERVEELFQGEAISAEKRDEAKTEVSLALARLQKAEENRELAKLDLERARAMLNRRTIKSPIAGVVVERFVSPGEFVDSQPLVKLAQMNPLRVEVILPAAMLASIKPGMKADIKPETQGDMNYSATVSIVDRVIDPASGTFGVRLELPNPDYQLPGGLKCSVKFVDLQDTASPAKAETTESEKLAVNPRESKLVTKVAP
jgi:RND family efflux transporter MFP subunit